jgi:hypothetical protein
VGGLMKFGIWPGGGGSKGIFEKSIGSTPGPGGGACAATREVPSKARAIAVCILLCFCG